jgi:uncharacterized membrane protein YhaH (DUF805 family)
MRLDMETLKGKAGVAWQQLFGGRISRTTFVIRTAIFFSVASLVALPPRTILATSTRLITDAYLVFLIGLMALCSLGFVSAYVKRLHDIGWRGYWAILILIGIPLAIMAAMVEYTGYLINQGSGSDSSLVQSVGGSLSWGLPLMLALWRGEASDNRFGPVPPPVEHVTASKFNVIAIVAAAAILIPTSIYVGLFQSGVWVGRADWTPLAPNMQSNVPGNRFMRCWNVKGVGAGSGDGPGGGVYRDGYTGNLFDFLVTPSGQIDIAMAGERSGNSFLADGFKINAYGLKLPVDSSGYLNMQSIDRFMLVAISEPSIPDGAINYTSFAFARTKKINQEYQVVISSALSLPQSTAELINFPTARGRLMIGDCMPD